VWKTIGKIAPPRPPSSLRKKCETRSTPIAQLYKA
jgi:hypothetical protein